MSLPAYNTSLMLASFSLLTATISTIIKPGGRQTLVEDAKFNIRSFSFYLSGPGQLS
ncbi:hypothetical protein BDW75DRAFT_206559 [Aspergillus navahoensis]